MLKVLLILQALILSVVVVIRRPATMKGWEKDVFWKIRALGNLKCSKSTNLKSRENYLKKYLKSNCIKSGHVQKDFSSILLKLQVTSLDSPEIVRTTVLQNTSVLAASVFYILQMIYQY